ncbi:MAG: hypothetical protein JNL39_18725, partial [Opitutaceae bacterium]|nr:hypothetical protein [Opitutaceae bacterium]
MPRPANPLRETILPLTLLGGDIVAAFGGLSLGYWFRYESALAQLGVAVPDADYRAYLPLLFLGVGLLIVSFAQFGLYDTRLLLRRYQSLNVILKGAALWLVAYLGVSLVLKFDPPISRLFVVVAFVCVVATLGVWRSLAYRVISRGALVGKLRRRVALLG